MQDKTTVPIEAAAVSRSRMAILKSDRDYEVQRLPFAVTECGAIQTANMRRSLGAAEMVFRSARFLTLALTAERPPGDMVCKSASGLPRTLQFIHVAI